MEQLPDIPGTLEWAELYAGLGWPILPIAPGSKIPAVRNWQMFEATPVNLRYWMGTRRCGVALRTGESGFVVVDTDTAEAEQWVLTHLSETPMRSRSGNGSTHRWYRVPPRKEVRNKQGWKGIRGLDVRGFGGYLILPGSIHPESGRPYEWLTEIADPQGLPVFSPRWVYERKKVVRTAVADVLDPTGILERGRKYVDTLPKAESGNNGHTTTFVASMKIARFVGFNRELAWQLLLYYNATRCDPPWQLEPELRHKLDEGLKHARRD